MTEYACLRDLPVVARDDVSGEPQEAARPFVLDVHWWVNLEKRARAARPPLPTAAEAVSRAIDQVIAQERDHTLKQLSAAILETLFEKFPSIDMVKLSARKLEASTDR